MFIEQGLNFSAWNMSKFWFLQFKDNTPKHRFQNHVFKIESKIVIFMILSWPVYFTDIRIEEKLFSSLIWVGFSGVCYPPSTLLLPKTCQDYTRNLKFGT